MGTQRKIGTSLNSERQAKLAEIVQLEPLACPSNVLAVSLDLMHQAWRASGCDLKAALKALGARGERKPPKGTPASVPGRVA